MWLLEASIKNAMEQAQKSGVIPNAEQQIQFEASRNALGAGAVMRIMTVAGATAEISVKGVLTQTPSFMAMVFGGGNTTYTDITDALASAEADPAITEIILNIDSPGGTIAGLFDTLAAIENVDKPIRAVVPNTAASAAYAIAAQADSITAGNRATNFGSVGVVVDAYADDDRISITSTDAPNKRPDIKTESGRAVVREELDALHGLFVESIAAGRGTTVEKINADFGRGGTFLADEALKRGMIDTISGVANVDSTKTASKGETQSRKGPMDLQTLKASHPDVYAAAASEGMTQERDRVSAHLIMGTQSGALDTAVEACKAGTEMTATLQATYMTAGMNRSDIAARTNDDASAAGADGATAPDAIDVDTGAEAVVAAMEAKFGVEV